MVDLGVYCPMLARSSPLSCVFPIISPQPLPFDGVTHSFASRQPAMQRVINEFRTLSIVTEGVPLHFATSPCTLARGVFCGAGLGTLLQSLLWAGKVGLAVANLIFAGHFDLNLPVGVCGASRSGIVAQPVLRTQLAVDAIENTVQFACGVREEHRHNK